VARTETPLLRGRDEIRAAWERQLEVFDDLRVEVIEVVADEGDRVITRTLLTGRGQGSDLPIEGRYVTVFTFRDGLTSSVESYANVAEALEAAGLSE
jgi:ketosteroid isomerase-like protein